MRRHPGSMVELGTNRGTMSEAAATLALGAPIRRKPRNGPRLKAGVTGSGAALPAGQSAMARRTFHVDSIFL